jgi:RNA polymerase sigma-70 factor (ECF subfamily)
MPLTVSDVDLFEAARPRLGAIAYRLLGSAGEAEDAVQETFLRWQSADRAAIEVPEAWLTKVLTNLCLNQLTSARARRETYVGQWLPEPLLSGDPLLGPAETVEQRESVSMAVLTLMERLSPNERAVYVLRQAFDYPHREIAEILDITEAASSRSSTGPSSTSPTAGRGRRSTRRLRAASSRSSSPPPSAGGPSRW